MSDSNSIDPMTRIGHIQLKVSDLQRSLSFYRDILGFEISSRFGDDAVFLSAGGYHHHIGLNTWESKGSKRPEKGTTGLFCYPDAKQIGPGKSTKKIARLSMATHWSS